MKTMLILISLLLGSIAAALLQPTQIPWKVHDPWNEPEYVLENGVLRYVGPGIP